MRLSPDQIQANCQEATASFGDGAAVWLFGSLTDDSKKGSDIDLLVRPSPGNVAEAPVPMLAFNQKIKMLTLLERLLGERKIDLLIERPDDIRLIVKVAHQTSIRLQ